MYSKLPCLDYTAFLWVYKYVCNVYWVGLKKNKKISHPNASHFLCVLLNKKEFAGDLRHHQVWCVIATSTPDIDVTVSSIPLQAVHSVPEAFWKHPMWCNRETERDRESEKRKKEGSHVYSHLLTSTTKQTICVWEIINKLISGISFLSPTSSVYITLPLNCIL